MSENNKNTDSVTTEQLVAGLLTEIADCRSLRQHLGRNHPYNDEFKAMEALLSGSLRLAETLLEGERVQARAMRLFTELGYAVDDLKRDDWDIKNFSQDNLTLPWRRFWDTVAMINEIVSPPAGSNPAVRPSIQRGK